MRCVSIAICTSGEPVSPSVVAYSVMICFLTSRSNGMGYRSSSVSRCAVHQGMSTWAL